MTQDEIIRMAQTCGFNPYSYMGSNFGMLVRFAELVAAAEKEECAKVMDDMAAQDKHSNYYKVAAKAIRARGEA